jgi:hypothetical protein
MYDDFWQTVLPILRRLETIVCTPYNWDVKGKRFVMIRNQRYVKRFRTLSYILYAHMVIMAWNLFQVFTKESNLLLQITSLGTAALTLFATLNRWMHQKGAFNIVQFLNGMVAFQLSSSERGNINSNLQHKYATRVLASQFESILFLTNSRARKSERNCIKLLNASN